MAAKCLAVLSLTMLLNMREVMSDSNNNSTVSLPAIAELQTCDTPTDKNVSVAFRSNYTFCPLEHIVVQCIVRLNSQNTVLLWDCKPRMEPVAVTCSNELVQGTICSFGQLNVTNNCDCTAKVIISEATILAPQPGGNTTVYCTNIDTDQEESISVAVRDLKPPKLENTSYTFLDDEHCNVTLEWNTTDDAEFDDMQYVLSVTNMSDVTHDETFYTTKANVTLLQNIYYSIVVSSHRCDGGLQSNSSNILIAICPVLTKSFSATISSSVSISSYFSANLTFSTDSSLTEAQIAGTILGVVGVIIVGVAGVCIILCILKFKSNWKRARVSKWTLIPPESPHLGEPVNEIYEDRTVEGYPLENVAGLCAKDNSIYVTCEANRVNFIKQLRWVQKRENQDNQVVSNILLLEGVGKLRGMGCNNCFYVVDRGENRILKYTESWQPLRKTCSKRFLNSPFGICVKNGWVLLCDTMNHSVHIFDVELNHKFSIPKISEPMGITFLKGQFFVTSRKPETGSIIVLSIDFINKNYTRCDIAGFKSTIRGICGKDDYLYVTERDGRILCLKYEIKFNFCLQWYKLDSVAELDHQTPVDIVCDENIYYSGKESENKCFVAKLNHNVQEGTMTSEKIYT